MWNLHTSCFWFNISLYYDWLVVTTNVTTFKSKKKKLKYRLKINTSPNYNVVLFKWETFRYFFFIISFKMKRPFILPCTTYIRNFKKKIETNKKIKIFNFY